MPKELATPVTPPTPDEDYFKVPLTRNEVLANPPKWEDYFASTTFVGKEQQDVIKRFEEDRKRKLSGVAMPFSQQSVEQYFQVLFELPKSIHAVETLRYIILSINMLYEENPEACLPILTKSLGITATTTLVKLVTAANSDWFVRSEGCRCIGLIVGAMPKAISADSRRDLNAWLAVQFALSPHERPADVRVAVQCLMKMLFHNANRAEFCAVDKFALLVGIATNCMTINKNQFVYESFYCIWLLSFEDSIRRQPPCDVISVVISALKLLPKEKITRVSLATLKNLSLTGKNLNRMIECQILKLLPQLQARKTADPEIEADLLFLVDELNKQASEMSTWDAFRHAVLGGVLDWAPVHKSESFWKENPFRFEEHSNEVLLALRAILIESKDPTTLSVACYDVGEFVLNHPKGKSIITKLDIKSALMGHMMSTEPEVKKHAVLAYQKIVLHGWEAASVM